jgi:hypothetical protein
MLRESPAVKVWGLKLEAIVHITRGITVAAVLVGAAVGLS